MIVHFEPSLSACSLESARTCDVLSALDKELKRLDTSICKDSAPFLPAVCRLRRLRNGFCSAVRLPTEILQWIFRDVNSPVFDTDHRCNLTNLAISWTCSHWRDVALDDPRLWAHLDLRFLELAVLFAERSRSSALSIRSLCRRDGNEDDWDADEQVDARDALCKTHLENVRILHYEPLLPYLADWLGDMPAPRLEELKIYSSRDQIEHFDWDWALIPRLFGNQMPRLQSLELHGHRLPFSTGSYRNLRSLRIVVSVGDAGPFLGTNEDFLTIFQECPGLETLELRILWIDDPAEPPATPTPRDRIDVPALRSLELCLPVAYIDHILTGVNLPVHQMISIAIMHSNRTSTIRSLLSETLTRHETVFASFFALARTLKICRLGYLEYHPQFTPLHIGGTGMAEDGRHVAIFLQGYSPPDCPGSDAEFRKIVRIMNAMELPWIERLTVEDDSLDICMEEYPLPL